MQRVADLIPAAILKITHLNKAPIFICEYAQEIFYRLCHAFQPGDIGIVIQTLNMTL